MYKTGGNFLCFLMCKCYQSNEKILTMMTHGKRKNKLNSHHFICTNVQKNILNVICIQEIKLELWI